MFQRGKQSDLIKLRKKTVILAETLQHANRDHYPSVVTIFTILLTMLVSTATPERSLNTMCRVKTHSTFNDENKTTLSSCPEACVQRHAH